MGKLALQINNNGNWQFANVDKKTNNGIYTIPGIRKEEDLEAVSEIKKEDIIWIRETFPNVDARAVRTN